jgi:tetratricopeptide (TPR) repeat protein
VAALNNLARLHESEGRTGEALALLEQAIDLCMRQGDRHHQAALYNHRADLLHRAGREDEAMNSLKAAVAIYAEIGMESGDWQPEIWKITEW